MLAVNSNSYNLSESQPKIIVTKGNGVETRYNVEALTQSMADSKDSMQALASTGYNSKCPFME